MKTLPAKILVADDSRTTVMFLSILLNRMGFDVIPVENGEDTLKLARIMRPDLIILDIIMPKLDGFGVLRKVREDQQISGTPVVVVTVKGDKDTKRKCNELGCDGFLEKPVKLPQLNGLLEKCIARKGQKGRRCLRVQFNRRVFVTYKGNTKERFDPTLS